MKRITVLLVVITLLVSSSLTAQVAINTDGSIPDNSALLDVKSSDKGVLISRMTQSQIESIANPADGLLVYNTDDGSIYVFVTTDNEWKEVSYGAGRITPVPLWVCGTSTITDSDNNTYNTVLIGSQCWMAENLATTKYNNDNSIPLVTDLYDWAGLTTPGYCWYDNDQPTYGDTYGALYNWHVVNTGNLCPTGWHVPSDAEFTTLSTYLGGTSVAGGKLKETGYAHWVNPNTGATNVTGFTALPGGYRPNNFVHIGLHGYLWSTTEDGAYVWYRSMAKDNSDLSKNSTTKVQGFSVRCIKD